MGKKLKSEKKDKTPNNIRSKPRKHTISIQKLQLKSKKKSKTKPKVTKYSKTRITVTGNKVSATLRKAKENNKKFKVVKPKMTKKNSKLRKKKKSEYVLKKSVGAGFEILAGLKKQKQNYRIKMKEERMKKQTA